MRPKELLGATSLGAKNLMNSDITFTCISRFISLYSFPRFNGVFVWGSVGIRSTKYLCFFPFPLGARANRDTSLVFADLSFVWLG